MILLGSASLEISDIIPDSPDIHDGHDSHDTHDSHDSPDGPTSQQQKACVQLAHLPAVGACYFTASPGFPTNPNFEALIAMLLKSIDISILQVET